MRISVWLTISLLTLIFAACDSSSGKKASGSALEGHWLIIYPEHKIYNDEEREVYGRHQDSIVRLLGLKLITLEEGRFRDVDSFFKQPGRWSFQSATQVRIQEGGKGFNPFTAAYKGASAKMLKLAQTIRLEGQKIQLVWHLKQLDDDKEAMALFDEEANAWRQKPSAAEGEKALRRRVIGMLKFYSQYFMLLTREASYFLPTRIPLPFKYYQHAIGMMDEIMPAFSTVFYNDADAAKAYNLLQQAVHKVRNGFVRKDNYVEEYALFMKLLAEKLES